MKIVIGCSSLFPTALPGDGKYPTGRRGSRRDAGETGSVVGNGPRRLHREVQDREPRDVQLGDSGATGEGASVRHGERSQRHDHQSGAAWRLGEGEGLPRRRGGGGDGETRGGEAGGGDDRCGRGRQRRRGRQGR